VYVVLGGSRIERAGQAHAEVGFAFLVAEAAILDLLGENGRNEDEELE
jgi:hypothetical protein